MGSREGPFVPTGLLESQLAALEQPDGEAGVVVVNIDNTPEKITDLAIERLKGLV